MVIVLGLMLLNQLQPSSNIVGESLARKLCLLEEDVQLLQSRIPPKAQSVAKILRKLQAKVGIQLLEKVWW